MGYAEKRGSGSNTYYIARYSDGRGKWPTLKDSIGRAVRFRKKRDAEKAADDEEAKVRGGTWHDPDAGLERFGTWASAWYARQDLAPRTMGNYRGHLESILLPEFEHEALAHIDAERVDKWEVKLRNAGFASDSIRTYRGLLSVIMGDAVPKKIAANPVHRPRNRGRRAGKAKHRAPEKPVVDPLGALLLAERAAILSGRDDEFVLVVTKAWTGARWGELTGLERPYFRMSKLRIEHQLEELDDGTWLKCPPKEDSRRDVDIPPFLSALISRQIKATQADRTAVCSCYSPDKETDPHPGGVYIFTGRTTRRRDAKKRLVPMTAAHWRRSGFESMIFKPAAEGWFPKKAPLDRRPVPVTAEPFPGLPVRGRNYVERSEACWTPIALGLTPHLLRHSHKSWMNDDLIDPKLSHERLGHEMGGVGARYSHVMDTMRERLIEALTRRWNDALDARIGLNPRSPVAVLDELLLARTARLKGGETKIVPQNSHSDRVVGLVGRPRKRA